MKQILAWKTTRKKTLPIAGSLVFGFLVVSGVVAKTLFSGLFSKPLESDYKYKD